MYLSICFSIYPSLAEEISAGSLHVCQDVLALRVGDVNLARRARPNVLIDDGGGGGRPLVVGLQRVVLRLESRSVKEIGVSRATRLAHATRLRDTTTVARPGRRRAAPHLRTRP